jgi:Transposase DDE domain group 1
MRVVVGWQGSGRNAASANTMSRFETEILTQEDNLEGLARTNPQWVEGAMAHTPHRRVILDLDSSESPVHGQQEGAAYNGHFECVCYRFPCSALTSSATMKERCSDRATFTAQMAGRNS